MLSKLLFTFKRSGLQQQQLIFQAMNACENRLLMLILNILRYKSVKAFETVLETEILLFEQFFTFNMITTFSQARKSFALFSCQPRVSLLNEC